MNKINNPHSEAMVLADKAMLAKLRGETEEARTFFIDAFEKEREAASLIAQDLELEPTRSVLHRSAAYLALECGKIREAERLIAVALSGDPPNEIAEELRDLLETVHFQRHLELRGIELNPGDFQVAIAGYSSVGHGIAISTDFIERVQNIEKMIYRTAERLLKQPFRESGGPKKELKKDFELYLSAPRAASMAVSFKIGQGIQPKLPGLDLAPTVLDEFMECFELFNSSKTEELKKKISDPPYFRNYIGLARNIAPDGKHIRMVGFTSVRNGKKKEILLQTPRRDIPYAEATSTVTEDNLKPLTIKGTLRFADAREEKKGSIQIIDQHGEFHRVSVPEGMMADIVKPMWECEVTVSGTKKGNTIYLEDIEKTN